MKNFILRAQCTQSEEGGRFYHSVGHYKIVEVPEDQPLPENEFSTWVTLAQIRVMLNKPDLISNELRSSLSLLLAYL
jgi:oxidase EvaA